MEIEALVCDYCNVVSNPFEVTWTKKACDLLSSWKKEDIDISDFRETARSLEAGWQRKELDTSTFFSQLLAAYNIDPRGRMDAFFSQAYTFKDLAPRPFMLSLLQNHYTRMPVIILSNSSPVQTEHMYNHLRPKYIVNSDSELTSYENPAGFVHAIVSSDVIGKKKSSEGGEMFLSALKVIEACLLSDFDSRLLVSQKNIVFFDDRQRNVDAAEKYFSGYLVGDDFKQDICNVLPYKYG